MQQSRPDAPDEALEVRLLEAIAGGNQVAFAQLYDLFSGILYSVALNMLGSAKPAEDVLQDVFVQIWAKAGSYDRGLGKPLTWALVLTRNKSIDYLRGFQRQERLRTAMQQEIPAVETSLTDETLTRRDAATLLRLELTKLPEDQREAIEMAFLGGLTQTQIAAALQQPLGTIKARIRRGMLKLREGFQRTDETMI